jgi:hypothetical protein
MVSRCLVEAFTKNSKPKGFEDTVPTSLHTYANVFGKTAFNSLPECHKWDHTIELECEPSPRFCKVYPMTLTEQTEMDAFLEEALATGCIRQSKSPLRAPVFFIKKKDGKLHFVQDYQALNAITRKNQYLLPLINNLIHWLKDACYFTKLDVCWGYNNVCIREGDECKVAFRMNRGLFEPLVMAALTKVKDEYTMYYNCQCEPALVFAPGDKFWLDGSDIATNRLSSKLSHQCLGPFVVEACVGLGAYCLALPPHFCHLHPIFPVIKLSPVPPSPILGRRSALPPPTTLVDGEEEYEVKAILDSHMCYNRLE